MVSWQIENKLDIPKWGYERQERIFRSRNGGHFVQGDMS